jgi:multisubunit Na+/H+ antiporter MnhB subunit
MGIIVVIFALLLAGCGVLVKKYPNTISGYNTMPPERRANVDIETVASLLQKGFLTIAAATIVIYFAFALLKMPLVAAIAGLLAPIFVGTPILLVMAQKHDKNPRKRAKKHLPAVIVSAITVAVLALVSVMIIRDMRPTEATIADGKITFSGSYGLTVPLAQIEKCELRDEIPRITMKTNGFALGGICKGDFRLDGLGKCRLYIDRKNAPYLFLETSDGRKIVYNSPDPAATREIFDALRRP